MVNGQRVKGFGQTVNYGEFQQGSLHLPDITGLPSAEVTQAVSPELHYAHALEAGRPIVSLAYSGTLTGARSFEVFPEKIVESSRSAHGVGFGRFISYLPTGRKRDDTLLSVAVKPFNDPETALREFFGYRKLGELGVETFKPVGVFPARNGDHFIGVTEARKDMMSLDRDEWVPVDRVSDARTAEINERNVRTVQDVSVGMAYIHSLGVFHPDGQIKNWSATTTGKIGIIDTENLKQVPLGHESTGLLAWHDIEKLARSLVYDSRGTDEGKMFGVGMLKGQSLVQLRHSIEHLIIAPYTDALTFMAENAGSDQDRQQMQDLFDAVIDRFYSDDTWPSHLVVNGSSSSS